MHKIPLNYNWKYCESFKEEYIKIFPEGKLVNIPHTNKELQIGRASCRERV